MTIINHRWVVGEINAPFVIIIDKRQVVREYIFVIKIDKYQRVREKIAFLVIIIVVIEIKAVFFFKL